MSTIKTMIKNNRKSRRRKLKKGPTDVSNTTNNYTNECYLVFKVAQRLWGVYLKPDTFWPALLRINIRINTATLYTNRLLAGTATCPTYVRRTDLWHTDSDNSLDHEQNGVLFFQHEERGVLFLTPWELRSLFSGHYLEIEWGHFCSTTVNSCSSGEGDTTLSPGCGCIHLLYTTMTAMTINRSVMTDGNRALY